VLNSSLDHLVRDIESDHLRRREARLRRDPERAWDRGERGVRHRWRPPAWLGRLRPAHAAPSAPSTPPFGNARAIE
jgi:hypothetical protein